MVSMREPCDRDRLRLLLDDRLPADEQTELAVHLERCEECCRALERLAAGSGFWDNVRLLDAGAASGADATHDAHLAGPADLDEESLGFLDLSDYPGSLGRLGSYEILEVLGRGGMGVVVKAHEPSLDRTVAIKVLAPALATSASARRRFAREARAAAAVAHEHIVAIHAVDEFHGLPYLVMQYVPGRSLQQRLDADGPPAVVELLRIGVQAASALAAAHAQGVVHRDVKPGNILLENCVERVRLTDFGLARVADDASLTHSGVIAGTPHYMAPEQARGEPVDHRADIYSLGAVLYTLATGRTPFRADSTMALLKRVCEDRPHPVCALNPEFPRWLEAVIERLMARDPADRFATAGEVAATLSEGLAHLQQPGVCPPPVVPGQPRVEPGAPRLARRPRRLALAATVLGLLGASLGASEAAGITRLSELAATVLRFRTPAGILVVSVDDPDMKVRIDGEELVITGAGPQEIRLKPGLHRVQANKDGRPVRDELVTIARGGREVVNVALETESPARPLNPPPSPIAASVPLPTAIRPLSEFRELRVMRGHSARVRGVAVSADGRRVLSGSEDRTVRLWDLETGQELRRFEGHQAGVSGVAISPDGRLGLSGSFDRTARTWDLATGAEVRRLERHGGSVGCVAFSPDGRLAATGGGGEYRDGLFLKGPDNSVRLWDVSTGREVLHYGGHTHWVHGMAFSPDGRLIASCALDPSIRVWDPTTGKEWRRFTAERAIWNVAFSPDARLLASAGDNLRLWDLESGWDTGMRYADGGRGIGSVAFAPDGRRLLSTGLDDAMRLWEIGTGRELAALVSHEAAAGAVVFTPDGQRVVAACKDNSIRVWEIPRDGAPVQGEPRNRPGLKP